MLKPNTLETVQGAIELQDLDASHEFLKSLFQVLKPGGSVSFTLTTSDLEKFGQLTKMVGFSNIQPSFEGLFKCSKPDISSHAGPAKIKRKTKTNNEAPSSEPVNPWANLGGDSKSNLINEDELMTKGEETAKNEAKEYCGPGDGMRAAKACANCSCGLKEKLEDGKTVLVSDKDKADLENGNTESACGKCYLGDAFRCASCPYRGVPAFEKGDKVKLVENDAQQQSDLPQDRVDVKPMTNSTKVMLNTDDMDMDF